MQTETVAYIAARVSVALHRLNPDPEIRESSSSRRRARPRFIGLLRREKTDLPGNYFVPLCGGENSRRRRRV